MVEYVVVRGVLADMRPWLSYFVIIVAIAVATWFVLGAAWHG